MVFFDVICNHCAEKLHNAVNKNVLLYTPNLQIIIVEIKLFMQSSKVFVFSSAMDWLRQNEKH